MARVGVHAVEDELELSRCVPASRSRPAFSGMTRTARAWRRSVKRSQVRPGRQVGHQVEVGGVDEGGDELAAGRALVVVLDGEGDVAHVEVHA